METCAAHAVSPQHTYFMITGVSDVDGDGNFATYVATKTMNPRLITPPDVY